MPRKLTRNAAAAAMRELDRKLNQEFKYAVKQMAPIDKAFLTDVLNLYTSQSPGDEGEIALAGLALPECIRSSRFALFFPFSRPRWDRTQCF